MASIYRISVLCLLFILFSTKSTAQSKAVLEDEAYDHLAAQDYVGAYSAFDKLHTRYPKELAYQYNLGICCLNYPEKKERAIELFKDLVTKNNTNESQYYLAKAYHSNYKFDEALGILRPLAVALPESKKKEDKGLLDEVNILIKNCENGKIFVKNQLSTLVVSNLGAPINTKELEAVPIITADESMMIYTYLGKKSIGGKVNASLESDPNGVYTTDIYMSNKVNDSTWGVPVSVTSLNSKAFDAAIGVAPDGSSVFTFLSTNESEGDILVSKVQGGEFSKPVLLNSNINSPDHWEGSCAISADGKFLYFTSERPNGLGGRDLYVSEWIDGDWGPATNLGPTINTPLNEDDPFIHPDGVTLFFSSQGHTSMGGYDIMYCQKTDEGWTEPRNMGIPINTTSDDRYYVVNSRGDRGYFSSDRPIAESKGGTDIYLVTPGVVGERLVVGLFKGLVYGDEKPMEARIDLVRLVNNENIGPYFSNAGSGKYLITLKPGSKYRIKVFAEGYLPIEEEINMENIENYAELKKDFYLYSAAFAGEKKSDPTKLDFGPAAAATAIAVTVAAPQAEPQTPEVPPTTETPKTETPKTEEPASQLPIVAAVPVIETKKEQEKNAEPVAAKTETKHNPEPAVADKKTTSTPCDNNLPDFNTIKGKSLNDPGNYQLMLNLAGSYCADNLVFKVQIGAYRNPGRFKYTSLKSLGKVVSENYPDGISRFALGQFKTIKDAEAMRQKAISRGQADSWIVAFIDGKRYTLEDLIMLDFLGKTIN